MSSCHLRLTSTDLVLPPDGFIGRLMLFLRGTPICVSVYIIDADDPFVCLIGHLRMAASTLGLQQ